jgi:two-component system, NarL family, sensor histidine kinase BarA
MPRRRLSKSSLERRGRFLFGLFILLTVAACLWWPWWQMERLVQSGDPDRAQAMARASLQIRHAILFSSDEPSRKQLSRLAAREGEKEPKVVRVAPPVTPPVGTSPALQPPGAATALPTGGTTAPQQSAPPGLLPFDEEAVQTFLKHPEESRYYQVEGDTLRYVQALRADNECLACHTDYRTGDLIGIMDLELNVKEHNKTLLAYRIVLVVAALLVVLFSMAVFYALFRYMVVRPVQHLKDVADRVSEGDLKVRSEIDTGNELEALSDAMNHMLDAEAKAQAELRAANTARDTKLDDLAKANVALFEMNQVKTKFLTTMSHELRTPLNSILGFAQILGDAPAVSADPKLSRYADNIQSSGRMLLEMINDLLDLAKIEAGRLEVRCQKVSPPDIAEAVCTMVRPLLAETNLKLSHEVDPAAPLMLTDATKVQQILYNLLSNAIKFTSEGEVKLSIRPLEGQRLAFAVSDTGPGIPRDEQLRIFERFTQLDSSYTRRYRGTGLGLSIVKELTGLLGGTVSVESEVGRGSTFTVVLPVDCSEAEGRAPAGGGSGEGPVENNGPHTETV